ncbi:MAG: hypothetical protein OEM81_05640 [Acidimicrobiia bacterium]|nr:hypothetical protein [Acidimicrobiia bacterium]MDH3397300.1 hypothetical protein [Acidimicrobiia bacterium]
MEALLLEVGGDRVPEWMIELADEFVEDPHCRLVLMGSDPEGVVLVTIWEAELVDEVKAGLASLTVDGVRLRRLAVVDPLDPVGMS